MEKTGPAIDRKPNEKRNEQSATCPEIHAADRFVDDPRKKQKISTIRSPEGNQGKGKHPASFRAQTFDAKKAPGQKRLVKAKGIEGAQKDPAQTLQGKQQPQPEAQPADAIELCSRARFFLRLFHGRHESGPGPANPVTPAAKSKKTLVTGPAQSFLYLAADAPWFFQTSSGRTENLMSVKSNMQVHVPGGATVELEPGARASDLAKKIKKDLKGAPVVARINGTLRDLTSVLAPNDEVEILTFEDPEGRHTFWHSSAHLLAQAIKRLYPEALPTIGPAIEEGFFYDFANLHISEEDFPRVEQEVQKIVRERIVPERIEFQGEAEARGEFGNNPFKMEIISKKEETLSAYRQGDFVDLCTGPHIPNTSIVQAFKVLKTSGAYWRGNPENEQLTRVYGISFPDKKQLSAYLHRIEEAKKRDHRVVGKRLDLFSFHEEGPGMPFFHPRGVVLWNELLAFIRELHREAGYVEIKTPVMLSRQLWETSGHWENYRENMYTSEVEGREFAIKPMNCPGCMLFFRSGQYSYRQLPLRVAEIGNVHRHEMSGALSGLFRVRSFHQDDTHIFMKPEDIKPEILGVLALTDRLYSTFGLEYHLELSTRPEKSIGSDEQWEVATRGLREALDASGREYRINEGDGAFYGPKIDMHIKDAIGRTWQCGTIQLDMALPERFDLYYDTKDGGKARPIMIHRAIYGSLERFLGILIEHYVGRFPLWCSPVQVRVLSVAERHHDYAEEIRAKLFAAGLRADADESAESIPKKVRSAQVEQVNYILVVGDQELENTTVNVRTRGGQVLGERKIDDLITALKREIAERAPEPVLV